MMYCIMYKQGMGKTCVLVVDSCVHARLVLYNCVYITILTLHFMTFELSVMYTMFYISHIYVSHPMSSGPYHTFVWGFYLSHILTCYTLSYCTICINTI